MLQSVPAVLEVEQTADATVARLTPPRIDESNAEVVGRALTELAGRAPGRPLHIDLGRVRFLSSVGLGLLIGLNKRLRAADGHLRLVNAQPMVYEVFAATHLTRVLDVLPQGAAGGPSLLTSA